MPRAPLVTLVLSLACIGIGQSMLFAVLPPAARELGVSPFQIATVFATSATIWVFASPRWGRRSDRLGRRRVILTGLLGYATSMLLVATTLTLATAGVLSVVLVYPLLIASRSVFAIAGSGTGPAAHAYVADRTTPAHRAPTIALLGAGMGIGETIGPALGGVLAGIGLAAPIYAAALLGVASAILIWWGLPETTRPAAPTGAAAPPRMKARDARVAPFVIVGMALQAVRATTVITLALYLQDTLELTSAGAARAAGIGFVALALSGLVAQLVVVQRLRPSPRTMIRIGTPLITAAFVLLASTQGMGQTVPALVLLGLGLGLVRPGLGAGVSLAVDPGEQGAAAGLLAGIAVVGNVVGPLAGTTVFAWSPNAPFVLNAAIMLPVSIYALGSRRIGAAVV